MGFFDNEVELRVPHKKQNNKTIEIKPLKGYDSMREKIDQGITVNVKHPAINEQTKPKTKVSIGL